MTKTRVMIVDDEETIRKLLKGRLEREGYEVVACSNSAEAETQFKSSGAAPVAVLVSDIKMPGKDGFSLMEWAKARDARCKVVLITGHGEKEVAIRALKWGASDYLEKPFDLDEFVHSVKRCMNEYELESEKAERLAALEARAERAEGQTGGDTWFVSKSKAMDQVNEWISVLRRESMRGEGEEPTVLVLGESGTGKEGIARMIHAGSRRGRGPWVAVNCANFNEQLLESELFGHERGAFTGATQLKRGLFELAHGGTLFLDEVGEMDPRLQAKLLRVIQEKTLRRVGGTADIKTDVRVIAATHVNLEKSVEKGSFREDLYHRINRVVIQVPSLRERTHDIIPMAAQFAEKAFSVRGKKFSGFSAESQAAMQGYRWPGNVRELLNVVERAALVAGAKDQAVDVCAFMGAQPASKMTVVQTTTTGSASVEAYSESYSSPSGNGSTRLSIVKSESAPVLQLQDAMESYTTLKKRWSFSFEREYLAAILSRHDGNVSAAAREAHLDRSNFLRLLRRHRMTAQEYRKDRESDSVSDTHKKAA
ncbi:MAG: sigma-54 dependent transcriptional regulator [Bdellovibrionales bacterium]|nr:sigma-54 dependent transcriptional regulator [Bdellovibrionales bacterium]